MVGTPAESQSAGNVPDFSEDCHDVLVPKAKTICVTEPSSPGAPLAPRLRLFDRLVPSQTWCALLAFNLIFNSVQQAIVTGEEVERSPHFGHSLIYL